jgi:hypothetical protein
MIWPIGWQPKNNLKRGAKPKLLSRNVLIPLPYAGALLAPDNLV